MNRRTLLATLGPTAGATAGCLEAEPRPAENSGTDAVVTHFDDEPARPECDVESEPIEVEHDGQIRTYETAETVPYPDPPASFATEDVLEYVESFDRAYAHHDVLCGGYGSSRVLRVGYSVLESDAFEREDEISVIALRRAAGATAGLDHDGFVWEAEPPIDAVAYAVDESGVARAAFDDPPPADSSELESHAPDPLEDGELVAAFE